MESDFSDFTKRESRLRGHSVGLKHRKSPFDSEGSHKFMKWKEIDGGQVGDAPCIGIIDKAL